MTGILGGSFDPIHKGHLQIARQVVGSLSLQQLQFMPCDVPVHRDQPLAVADDRGETATERSGPEHFRAGIAPVPGKIPSGETEVAVRAMSGR